LKKKKGIARRAVVLGSLVLLAAAAFSIWIVRPGPVVSPAGEELGKLPRGVVPSDLNLLLITLDTTRADRIHAYGFPDVETPNLDRIAEEGVLFEQAISAAPLTLPAHSTIFTSKYPPSHGVRDNGGFFLDESESTLAELLRESGRQTGGFVGAYVLDSKWGVDQGFETYFDDFDLSKEPTISLGSIDRTAEEVAERALDWLASVGSSRFFGWVHFYDPHAPYTPPEPFQNRYASRPYVGEIAYTDSQVGRILDWLNEHDLMEKTVVIVIGDHGESLSEHGEARHGFFVYESAIRVPFLIRAPYDRMKGHRVDAVVRSVDVLPTVLDLLALPPQDGVEGVSLVSLMTGTARELDLDAYAEAPYPRFHFGWSDLRSLRVGRYKYIDAPRPELYDIEQDPEEMENLHSERQRIAENMERRLRELEQRLEASSPELEPVVEIDPDTRDRLAALGYIGTFVSAPEPSEDRSALADPKDKIELFNLMLRAREASRQDPNSDEGIRALTKVVREDPEVIDAWFMLGNEYFKRREFERAIDNYARALELKPDYYLAVINMANAYRQAGEDDKALVGYRRFLELDPKNPQIRFEMAQVLIDKGELDEATEQLGETLRLEPKMAAARNALGVVRIKRGDVKGAETEILAALELKPDVRHANVDCRATKGFPGCHSQLRKRDRAVP
jgi:arylsulfatase A-like enzyme/Flp pilus assembly protein TadD